MAIMETGLASEVAVFERVGVAGFFRNGEHFRNGTFDRSGFERGWWAFFRVEITLGIDVSNYQMSEIGTLATLFAGIINHWSPARCSWKEFRMILGEGGRSFVVYPDGGIIRF